MMKTPTPALVAGLVFTLLIMGAYAAHSLLSVAQMRQVQTGIVERNRKGSLQLIRIQNDLNALALAMRDMLETGKGKDSGYPLLAWKAPLARMRQNLEDAIRNEAALSQGRRAPEQTAYLRTSLDDFWRACDEMFARAASGDEDNARLLVRTRLQPSQEALAALTARLLVENNEEEARGGSQVSGIYEGIEANAYRFLILSAVLIVLMSYAVIRTNRSLFSQLSDLAEQRSELARQLITTQESTFRAISRDLHDEFGQILTALGAMLRRANRLAPDTSFREQVREAEEVVQGTLENIRSLSQSLQPVILEEQGLKAAIEWHLPVFERQTGIPVLYDPPPDWPADLDNRSSASVHVFRVLQESLNNVARHSGATQVNVTIQCNGTQMTLLVSDNGRGLPQSIRPGVGLAAMRERAALTGGVIRIDPVEPSGTRITLQVPLSALREASPLA
jgi:signal transduction histidine kinase